MQDSSSYVIQILDGEKKDNFQATIEKHKFFGSDQSYYERLFERQGQKELEIIIAIKSNIIVGYVLLNWHPKYAYFRKLDLPEIQDLNVIPQFRRNGIGKSLIEFCEKLAFSNGYDEIGIGVGLDFSFGAAQRIYARLGYIPDGQGVSYDRKQVNIGELRPIDENLCLMMTKKLK